MIRREGKGPPSTSDLLVCFPRRAHLTLMPKPACSPRQNLQRHYQNHLKKSMRGGRNLSIGGGHASPYTLSGSKHMGSDNLSEPTSPKVTCAGQIKVRPSTKSCKNWQSVMEEIERLHNNNKKKSTWVETLGFKKEVMHFLSCLRKLKFDFHCVGAFSHVDISSDDEDGDNNDIEINQSDQDQGKNHPVDDDHDNDDKEVSSRTVFSKWFVVLQENQECDDVHEKDEEKSCMKSSKETEELPCPPPNALLLMRCRSAPAKSWMEEKEEEDEQLEKDDADDQDHDDHEHDKEEEEDADKENQMENKEIINKRKSLMELMQIESGDFYKLSCDIAKETWVIGGIHKDPFSRSRSWKR